MSKDLETLSRNLATRIIQLRQKRKMTQGELAKLSGIPRSTIANLESGGGNPSLSNLAKICEALHVPIEEILSTPRSEVHLLKRADVPVNKKGRSGVLVYNLLPDPLPGMTIERMEFPAKSKFGGTPHTSETKEYFHCVQGKLTIVVSGESYDLVAGDVLAFPGEAAHAYINSNSETAMGFSVVAFSGK